MPTEQAAWNTTSIAGGSASVCETCRSYPGTHLHGSRSQVGRSFPHAEGSSASKNRKILPLCIVPTESTLWLYLTIPRFHILLTRSCHPEALAWADFVGYWLCDRLGDDVTPQLSHLRRVLLPGRLHASMHKFVQSWIVSLFRRPRDKIESHCDIHVCVHPDEGDNPLVQSWLVALSRRRRYGWW